VERFGVVGTSMGGIMGMLMAAQQPGRIWALALNDIGPVVDEAGIERIKGYVGRPAPAADWAEAAARARAINAVAHPDYDEGDWLAMARRLFREDAPGRISPDYDPAIGEAMKAAPVAAGDMWPLFEAIKATPMLVIRGALSDLLSAATVAEMQTRAATVEAVEVPRTGHTPTLAEPPVVAAIADFLRRNAP
jgi:pimeloyl-ACP methyl ester carboxylesterase